MTTSTTCLSSPSSPFGRFGRLRSGFSHCVAASLLLVLQGAAWAQAAPASAPLDPPGRVTRLNLIEGAVSFAPADAAASSGDNAWTAAVLNRPLTSGDRLWTGQQARTELHTGSTAVRMSEQTSLDFVTLDDNVTQLRLAQGTIKLRVRSLFEGQRLEVDTPNLAFVISQPGDYRVDAYPASNSTRVVAQSGAAVIYGDSGMPLNLGSQQQGSFTGTDLTPAAPGASVQDSFDAWARARDQREDRSVSARYLPRETVGYQQLDNYGDWSQDPAYGAVWLPRAVPVNWAPYRVGHWSWIAPWGWTWIDDAPWGFAPFHYGRWAQIGPRWAWVPGRLAPRPVYAPALVAFVGGNSGGVNWSLSIGSGPSVGWFPLAPGEAFRPAYRASPRYVTQVNNNIVVNNITTNVTNNTTNVYRYQRQPAAVTALSAADFASGRPVRGNQQALNAADLRRAQVVTGSAAERGALPQGPDRHELARPAPAAALPPAAVLAARPVVDSREEHRHDRRNTQREERPRNSGASPLAQAPLPQTAPPSARPGPAVGPPVNAVPAAPVNPVATRRSADEAVVGQSRREPAPQHHQAPQAGLQPSPPVTVPAQPNDRDAAGQAQRAAQEAQARQTLQREQQQRQQRDQARQQQAQQAQKEQQGRQQAEAQQQHAQQAQQQKQAREQAQGQQKEQHARQAEERQQARRTDPGPARELRPDAGINRNREP